MPLFSALVRRPAEPVDVRAAALAGLAAGAAYLVEMVVDLRLSGRNVDDLHFLGGALGAEPRVARRLGFAIHVVNSIALAVGYARLAEPRLGGPGWRRGVVFASAENVVLYPLTALEGMHPAIRAGRLDRYFTWPAFLLSVPRHIAYGAVLGGLYERLRR